MYFFFFTNNIDLVPAHESPAGFWRCPADQKARRLWYNNRPTTVEPCDMSHFKQVLTTPENTITYHNALCLSPQILHGVRQTQTADLQTGR